MKNGTMRKVKQAAAGVLAALLLVQVPAFVLAGDSQKGQQGNPGISGEVSAGTRIATPSSVCTPSGARLSFAQAILVTKNQAAAWVRQLGDAHWSVDVDGDGEVSCSDLIMIYMQYLLGWYYDLDGCDYRLPAYCPEGWQQIRARDGFTAQPGDIAIWTGGDHGHAGIVLEGTDTGFVLCDIDGWETEAGQHEDYADYGHRNFDSGLTYSFWGVLRPDWPAASAAGTVDLNGLLDGVRNSGTASYGTADVYINGTCVADDVTEFHGEYAEGVSYEIKDIKAEDGHIYNGTAPGSAGLSGTILGNATRDVRLSYSSVYTVKFVTDRGTAPQTQSVEHGGTVGNPGNLTWTGYTFGGWYADSSFKTPWNFGSSTVTGNMTLYAKWTRKSYSVTFNNGGRGNAVKAQTVSYGDCAKDPGNLTAVGYTFGGWYADSKYKTKWDFTGNKITKAVTLYAKWTVNTYTVRFNGNGSTSGSVKDLTGISYGKSFKLSANTFKKTGYTFTGWNTAKKGTGTSYADKAGVKNLTASAGKVITLYAQWVKNYSITYALNGGTNSSKNPAVYTKAKAVTLNSPTRAGYRFDGWYSDSKFKTRVYKISKGTTGNKKFYAKWTRITYTVKFSGNGATSGSMQNMKSCKGAATYKLAVNRYKRTGYTFAGWNRKANGSGKTYKNGASVKNLTASDKATVVLYAQWKANKYTIRFSANGGTGSMSSVSAEYGCSVKLAACTMTKSGQKFEGWNTKADGSGKDYADKTTLKSLTGVNGGTVTLYAQWSGK